MTIIERHSAILEDINKSGSVEVLDLEKRFKVSAVTIRKDLKFLEEKGLLFRSHGGATKNNPYINEKPVNEKELINAEEKKSIAVKAAEQIKNNHTIIIASGTTVLALAKLIRPKSGLTAITSSLNVALELNRHQGVEVYQLGGPLRKSSYSTTGPFGEQMLDHFSCNLFFLGIDGLDFNFGLTTTSLPEAHLNKRMMRAAQKTIVLADSSKFGKRGFGKICDVEDVDLVITDNKVSEKELTQFEDRGVKVIVAG